MTPYVIDNKKRQEYFLFLIFFTVISFGLGYFFGFQNGQSSVKEIVAVVQPVPVEVAEAQAAEELNTKENGKKKPLKDKKQKPDKSFKKTAKADKKTNKKVVKNEKPKAKSKLEIVKSDRPKKVTKKITKSEPKAKQVIQAKSGVEKPKEPAVKDNETSKTDKQVTANDGADEKTEQTAGSGDKSTEEMTSGYSVQAGMFANKENAEKYVDKLKDSGFEAFVVGFISTSGKQKYNVRFGKFSQRKDASNKMLEYKQLFTTPAYIVINK